MAALLAAIAFGGLPTLELGELLAFAVAAAQFVAGSLLLSTALPQLAGSSRLYRRVAPIVHAAPELEQTGNDPGVLRGAIDVAHVSFRYSAAGPSIINDVSLHIQPGETVAIVGPSGCGKSTLVRLLLGFERPDAGHIVYDGQDLATLDLRDVRRQLGVVLQHGTLMADTILNNIVGSSLAAIEQAWQAARLAGIEDEIRQLPMGMHTLLAEGGATLSGGQRQRLLIARALVNRPRHFVFDEATSALDNTTQAIVTHSIAGLAATRVLIAHRLSTVRHADRIYVLDRGSVVQSGTYARAARTRRPIRQACPASDRLNRRRRSFHDRARQPCQGISIRRIPQPVLYAALDRPIDLVAGHRAYLAGRLDPGVSDHRIGVERRIDDDGDGGADAVIGLIAGVFVDRWDRKRIMVTCELVRAVLIGLIPLLLPFGITWLYIMVLLASSVAQFFDPAHASVLPEVASDQELGGGEFDDDDQRDRGNRAGFAAAGLIASQFSIQWAFYF